MEGLGLLKVVLQVVPLNHCRFDPFPTNFKSFLDIVLPLTSFYLLRFLTEALNHTEELSDEVGDSARELDDVFLDNVEFLELRRGLLLIPHGLGTSVLGGKYSSITVLSF